MLGLSTIGCQTAEVSYDRVAGHPRQENCQYPLDRELKMFLRLGVRVLSEFASRLLQGSKRQPLCEMLITTESAGSRSRSCQDRNASCGTDAALKGIVYA